MPALRRYKESSSGHFLRPSCPSVRHARATFPIAFRQTFPEGNQRLQGGAWRVKRREMDGGVCLRRARLAFCT